MNFSKNQKKNQPPTEKFYRSSALFMQLGLVLALLIVYISLEYTSTKTVALLDDFIPDDVTYVFTAPPDIIIKRKSKPQEKQVPKKATLIDLKVVPDHVPVETILDLPTENNPPPKLNIGDIVEIVEEGPVDEGPIDFFRLEEAPVFPGCEGLKDEESRACFTEQMTKFVNKKFDASIAEGLHLEGKQRIFAQFTINKMGLVTDIQIRAPHKTLEKEALRVIQKLPEMVPGKQRKRPVPVKYTLPIVFQIE